MQPRVKIQVEYGEGFTQVILSKSSGREITFKIESNHLTSCLITAILDTRLQSEIGNWSILESRSKYLNSYGLFPSLPDRCALYLLRDRGVHAIAFRTIKHNEEWITLVELPDGAWLAVKGVQEFFDFLFQYERLIYCGTLHLTADSTESYQIAEYIHSHCMM